MMEMIALVLLLSFLAGLVLFHGAVLPCVLGLVLSAGILLLRLPLPLWKPLSARKRQFLGAIGLALLFTVGLLTGTTATKGGVVAFDKETVRIRNLLDGRKTAQARKALQVLVTDYGTSNTTLILDALTSAQESNFDAAFAAMGAYGDKTSMEYAAAMETLLLLKADPAQADALRSVYFDAAWRYPRWTHMQKMAGISRLDTGEPAKAEYLLLRASEQNPGDFETAYYLGVAYYRQNALDEAAACFEEALDLGAFGSIQEHIAWYAQEMTR